jgi:CNT family concentrative nucleoside transporter
MTGGMATIAGGVFAAYIGFVGGDDIEMQRLFARHLLTASIMSAPAAIVAAKMLYPQAKDAKIDRKLVIPKEKIGTNILDAISIGTTDGLKLAINVGAMLLVFTAFMYMLNGLFGWVGDVTHLNEVVANATNQRYTEFNLQFLLGVIFAPLAWVLGVESQDMLYVGQLLGEKTMLNEFFAYTSLGNLKDAGAFASERSIIIATYALCGFANFASIGIQIGGIGALAPNQRPVLVKLGFLALIGGTIACFLTATIAGMLVG